MSTTPLYFTGVSSYSSDLQSILSRQVAIAQVPITRLQNTETDNTEKKTLLGSLNAAVAGLGSSLAALGAIGNNKGLTATSSDKSVSITNTGATQPATHTISNVTSLATAASETSVQGYASSGATSVSSSGSLQLILGNTSYPITLAPGKNNLAGLRDAINASGASVAASIITTGNGSTPNYLQVTATTPGATTLQLNDLPGGGNPVALLNNAMPLAESGQAKYANTNTTAVSANGAVNLVVRGTTYALDVSASNNLDGLAQAINGSGADVTASIADAGAAAGAQRYSLLVTANHLGQTSLQLNDVAAGGTVTNLLSSVNNNATQGSNAVFLLDGLSITKQSNYINDVIPGVTFNLLTQPSGNVTLRLSSDRSALTGALSDLAGKYNAVITQMNAQRGPSAGLLNGDFAIQAVADDIRQLATYQASGATNMSLATLGVTFDTSGQMSFDSTAVNQLSDTNLSIAFRYLGSAKTGFGAIASQFQSLSNPISGLIKTEQNGIDTANRRITNQINGMTDRLTAMQAALTSKLQATDAALAGLQSQQQVLTSSVAAVSLALYGKGWASSGS